MSEQREKGPVVRVAFALFLAALASAPTQAVSTGPLLVRDPLAVLRLVRGEVMMVGAIFPDPTFQKGILSLLRTRTITSLTVLTTQQNVANYGPLQALGARIYYLPISGVTMSGNIIFSGPDVAITSNRLREWYVVRTPGIGVQGRTSMNLYLKSARRY